MMPKLLMNKTKGVALIQVLLISAILSMMAIQLNKSAKINTNLTQGFSDKTEALINLRDAESMLFYKLLTQNDKIEEAFEKLNYYGEPFNLNEQTVVTLQDTAGLNNIHSPNLKLITKWALNKELDESKAASIIDELKDWQDNDDEALPNGAESKTYQNYGYTSANVKLSAPEHLRYILSLNEEEAESLAAISTVQAFTAINPYHFPKNLLSIYYGEHIAQEIIEQRSTNEMTHRAFTALTGDSDGEGMSFNISPYVKVNIDVSYGNAKVSQKNIVELVPFFKAGQAAISKLSTKIN